MATSLNSCSITVALSWSVQATVSGAPASTNASGWNPKLAYTSGSGAGNALNYVSVINTLAGAANSTYDLTATFTDMFGTAVNMATIRVFVIALLSTTQTGPDGATLGTSSSSITFGNAAGTQAFTAAGAAGFFGSTTHTGTVPNGGFCAFGVANAGGFTAGASFKSLKVLNNDGSNTATFALVFAHT